MRHGNYADLIRFAGQMALISRRLNPSVTRIEGLGYALEVDVPEGDLSQPCQVRLVSGSLLSRHRTLLELEG